MGMKQIPYHRTSATVKIPWEESIEVEDAGAMRRYRTRFLFVELARGARGWTIREIHASANAEYTRGGRVGCRKASYDIHGFEPTEGMTGIAEQARRTVARDSSGI